MRAVDPGFARDLYRGTARDYDEGRPGYPDELIDDLLRRSGADGAGRLVDLACGTGQVSFAMRDRFADVWAVDQEPDMVAMVREKARAAGADNVRAVAGAAEELSVPDRSVHLVAVGNAFHRLSRRIVAERVYRWLRPGGFLALLWCDSPWRGSQPWQRAMAGVVERWMVPVRDRIPAGYERQRQALPDPELLRDVGFEIVGRYRFSAVQEWTPEALIRNVFSTSVLSRDALGAAAADLEAELQVVLAGPARLAQDVDAAYDLARTGQATRTA